MRQWLFYGTTITFLLASLLMVTGCTSDSSSGQGPPEDDPSDPDTTEVVAISAPPAARVQELSLDDSFYKQYLDANGIPIVASASVNPYALREAAWIIDSMLAIRPDLSAAIASTQTRLAIMAVDEFTTDIPEHSDLQPANYWDRRARGLGATDERPAVSTGEENLLQLPGDPYETENILVHEFAHVIHQQGMPVVDPTFEASLQSFYDQAVLEGLWQGTYAGSNVAEYFAEGMQSWFGTNRENDAEHNDIDTREELINYDPRLAGLIAQVLGDNTWQYEGPRSRQDDREHLAGFDVQTAGVFAWPDHLIDVDISDNPDADLQAARLPNVLAEDWSAIASPGSSEPVDILFYNSTGNTVTVDWIDFEGVRQLTFTLLAGERASSLTYMGHLWEVVDLQGIILARFRSEAEVSLAYIE